MTEEEVFFEFAENVMGLTSQNVKKFREICLVSNRAILLERYIEKYDDAWCKYKKLSETDDCATLYTDQYYGDGIGESVNRYRNI